MARVTNESEHASRTVMSTEERLALFDASTLRQQERNRGRAAAGTEEVMRGWKREELYSRGRRH